MKLPRHISAFKYHLPYRLSGLQQMFLLPYFGLKVLNDPTRGDLVAAIGNSLTLSLTYLLTFSTYSLIHLFTYSLIPLLIHRLTNLRTHSLTRSHSSTLSYSIKFAHLLIYSFTHLLIYSFTHLLIDSFSLPLRWYDWWVATAAIEISFIASSKRHRITRQTPINIQRSCESAWITAITTSFTR